MGYTTSKELINAMVSSSENLEEAESHLEILEDKAVNQRIITSEFAAVRYVMRTRVINLDDISEKSRFKFVMSSPILTLLEGNRKYNASRDWKE